MSNEVINPDQQFLDATGEPLASGTVTFYVNETTTLSTIYSDESLTVPQANPYTLDAAGRITADIKFTGKMRVVQKDRTGAVVRTIDNVTTLADGSAAISLLTQPTYASLESAMAAGDYAAGDAVTVASTATPGINGPGVIHAIGSYVANIGTIRTGGSFAWVRDYVGEVRAIWFGYGSAKTSAENSPFAPTPTFVERCPSILSWWRRGPYRSADR